jgi:hypothetical protein
VKHIIGSLVAATVLLIVAAEVLPHIIIPATVLFSLAVVGRFAWFYTK